MTNLTEREKRQDEYRRSAIYGTTLFDPRSVYPSYPDRESYIDWEDQD